MEPVPPAPARTNNLAVVSLALSLAGVGLVGFVVGIFALRQIKERGERGRGLAIAGVVIPCVLVVAASVVGAVGVVLAARKPAQADVAVAAPFARPSLGVGDCVRELGASFDPNNMPVVDCGESHTAEVYTIFSFPPGEYPGEAAIEAEADEHCSQAFEPYAAKDGNEGMDIYYTYPSKDSWLADRAVTCVAADPAGTRTTSLMD
ncbi:DUF4190 domain-containing protein [Winogradskya humida]|uniref:Regulator of septum formation n=1 Tax=Winogradskya humida TaxID=113566 RepID=A0ABQ3ZF74_9ACTN|nr:DUF4190 domain-containing protein [Actinoplanes humidus]GIE17215.1 hypothetical protein Ahu01nite_003170 [Actinoplanes humidus]